MLAGWLAGNCTQASVWLAWEHLGAYGRLLTRWLAGWLADWLAGWPVGCLESIWEHVEASSMENHKIHCPGCFFIENHCKTRYCILFH